MKSPTSKDYRKAAELIFARKVFYASQALEIVTEYLYINLDEMGELFGYSNFGAIDCVAFDSETILGSELCREVRIMALLFMSEITKGRG